MEKICKSCLVSKPIEDFGINNALKSGIQNKCKICLSNLSKKIRKTDSYREKRRISRKESNEKDNRRIEYYNLKKNRDPKYYELLNKAKDRSQENRKMISQSSELKSKVNEVKNNWDKKKRLTDNNYRTYKNFKSNFRSRYINKKESTFQCLNYSFEEFIESIGFQPQDYHLDHKIPVTWFKEFIPNEIYSLDNLHWISKTENITKRNCWAHPVKLSYFKLIEKNLKPQYLNRFEIIYDNVVDVLFS